MCKILQITTSNYDALVLRIVNGFISNNDSWFTVAQVASYLGIDVNVVEMADPDNRVDNKGQGQITIRKQTYSIAPQNNITAKRKYLVVYRSTDDLPLPYDKFCNRLSGLIKVVVNDDASSFSSSTSSSSESLSSLSSSTSSFSSSDSSESSQSACSPWSFSTGPQNAGIVVTPIAGNCAGSMSISVASLGQGSPVGFSFDISINGTPYTTVPCQTSGTSGPIAIPSGTNSITINATSGCNAGSSAQIWSASGTNT